VTELLPYQREGVEAIYGFRGRVLLADEMGLGKTLQTLYWISRIKKHRPVIIVCPASLKYTWQAEAMLHLGMRTEVLEGNYKGADELPGSIVILNYDILGSWLPLLLQSRPRCVVLDEVQFIKSLRAQRTKHALKLVQNASSVLGLSGTPLTNRPIELWPILKAIRPDLFPSMTKYAWRYCAPRWAFYGWRFDGAVHLKELHGILRSECMIRRLKKDVLPQLPPKRRKFVCFQLKPSDQKVYDEARDDFLRWLEKASAKKARKARKAEALVKIGYLVRLAARLKLDWTTRWIADFFEANPGEKLVTFTMHTFVIDHLREKFPDRCVVVDGRVTGRKREESVRQFRSHRKKDLFLGNWIAAGVGLTLTAASNVAGLDLPWTPGELLQGEDRIHRIGQKKLALIHYLIAQGTIEEKQIKILQRKTKILDAVLDGRKSAKDLDLFNTLMKEMKNE
jgi:SWI/SNF-related matrix-associated actin-dependent regulator of chromatin subfamily A-like protein 1